jgi:hypothetical protein
MKSTGLTNVKMPPTPRSEVYDLYWYFASERQSIFEKRQAKQAGPWTKDEILTKYKFCNVFRATDRVSQYMIRTVIYNDQECSPQDKIFQIIAFRFFSKIETWELIEEYLGRYPLLKDLACDEFEKAVNYAKNKNGVLYTGAFILCANNAYHQPSKYLNHIELFRHMFLSEDLAGELLSAKSLEEIYNALHKYPLMGDFMSYQIAIDLNYSDLLNFSENDFTKPGPGAMRGIKKAFSNLGDYTPTEIIMWMVDNQDKEFKRLGLKFEGLAGRKLHAIDCQGLFCELDKYCRVALPSLTSGRKRMKAQFAPKVSSPPLFLPPKWMKNVK